MNSTLVLPPAVRGAIELLVREGYPNETCGLLLGRKEGERVRVVGEWPARNLCQDRARDRFELDPQDYLAAEAAASQAGVSLVGVWHSHPDHPAKPSPTDRAMAWPDWSYLIVSVDALDVVDERSWRLDGDQFCEEEVRDG